MQYSEHIPAGHQLSRASWTQLEPIVWAYAYLKPKIKDKPSIWFFELRKNLSRCHCTVIHSPNSSRHHRASFTRVTTICTMAHLKRVSKSRGNAAATVCRCRCPRQCGFSSVKL